MLQIGAHVQRQWGVFQLPRSGRALPNLRAGMVSVACGSERGDWIGRFRSKGRGSTAIKRLRWGSGSGSGRRQRVTVMESASSEPRPREAENLLNDGEPAMETDTETKWATRKASSWNSKINKASKWLVVGLVIGGVLWKHDEHALWFMIGGVVNGALCKLLKYLINQNRPATADGVKEDPGMPSSHAQGFSSLATYVTLTLLVWQGINIWTSLLSVGLVLSSGYLIWLRVAEGLHTGLQVLVGTILGSGGAAVWFSLWNGVVGAAVSTSSAAKLVLYISFVVAAVLCYFISVKDWQLGEP